MFGRRTQPKPPSVSKALTDANAGRKIDLLPSSDASGWAARPVSAFLTGGLTEGVWPVGSSSDESVMTLAIRIALKGFDEGRNRCRRMDFLKKLTDAAPEYRYTSHDIALFIKLEEYLADDKYKSYAESVQRIISSHVEAMPSPLPSPRALEAGVLVRARASASPPAGEPRLPGLVTSDSLGSLFAYVATTAHVAPPGGYCLFKTPPPRSAGSRSQRADDPAAFWGAYQSSPSPTDLTQRLIPVDGGL